MRGVLARRNAWCWKKSRWRHVCIAVSCTGQGEMFMRHVAAYDLAARIAYAGETLEDAARTLVFETLVGDGIGAGLVALGAHGDPVAPYNTLGMYRGWISTAGEVIASIIMFCIIYALLGSLYLYVLLKKIRHGPPPPIDLDSLGVPEGALTPGLKAVKS